ncbi:hypothetical protein EHS13_11430 [Paenibacillus psychroresistens]|uniref:Uncharacterized protein n=1 Tax=Paenibacillus psychroresistens TaxID=1778678 RepID=A0A6B8RGY9_9BACL|nr:hypothetical protein [Paenibacillus psychroresistens]QGQ95450.1 hypothetical protein EHS13_11430 [Paenibacillus psychroresistens]
MKLIVRSDKNPASAGTYVNVDRLVTSKNYLNNNSSGGTSKVVSNPGFETGDFTGWSKTAGTHVYTESNGSQHEGMDGFIRR